MFLAIVDRGKLRFQNVIEASVKKVTMYYKYTNLVARVLSP